MTTIDAQSLDFRQLNQRIRGERDREITVAHCLGQRYIASGLSGRRIVIEGTPGNALGAYLDGCELIVRGNAQDATGDTMNDGSIVIHGSAGDATGYAMRGGTIFVEGGHLATARGISHEGIQRQTSGACRRRNGRQLPRGISGGGHHRGASASAAERRGKAPVGNFCGTECTAAASICAGRGAP